MAEQQPRVLNPLITFLVPVKCGEFLCLIIYRKCFGLSVFPLAQRCVARGEVWKLGKRSTNSELQLQLGHICL